MRWASPGAIAAALFLLAFLIYLISDVTYVNDPVFAPHVAASLVLGDAGELSRFRGAIEQLAEQHGLPPYQIVTLPDGRLFSLYPLGAPLFATPFMAAWLLVDSGALAALEQGPVEGLSEAVASFYAAGAVALAYLVVRRRSGDGAVSLVTALLLLFGTSLWSVASRSLWQHGPLLLVFVAVIGLLLQPRLRGWHWSFLGFLLALAVVVRPSAVLAFGVASFFVLLRAPRAVTAYLGGAALVAIPWLAYNLLVLGEPLPPYYRMNDWGVSWFGEALLAHLVSPSRGLFVFSPFLVLSLPAYVLLWRSDRELRGPLIVFGSTFLAHLLLVSAWRNYWGGHSYGPRLMLDVVPFLLVPLGLALARWREQGGRAWSGALAVLVVLALPAFFIHERGATRSRVVKWNISPQNIDEAPQRIWDWRDPQFLR